VKKNFINASLIAIICIAMISGNVVADDKSSLSEQKIEKFKAHEEVQKLQNDNYKNINLIEIISKNFGYTFNDKFKKDYWTARILVSKKQIVQAKELLEKNKKEIDEALKLISEDYRKATQVMLDDCINKLNEYEFSSHVDDSKQIQRKISTLRNKITVAVQQFDSANDASVMKGYASSISLYRTTKSYAINILKDLAGPEEKENIIEKYKIHIVDNRNEIYKKS
jgi:hypothetical protein